MADEKIDLLSILSKNGEPPKKYEVKPPEITPDEIGDNLLNSLYFANQVSIKSGPTAISGYDIGARGPDLGDMEDYRGRMQSRWSKWGSGLARTGIDLTVGSVKAMTDIPDVIRAFANEKGLAVIADPDFQNVASKTLENIIKITENSLPIYRDKESRGFSPLSASWVTGNLPTIASGMTMLVPIIAAERAISLIPKGINYLARGLRTAPIITPKVANYISAIGGAYGGNLFESYMELQDMMPQAKQQLLANGYSEQEADEILNKEAQGVVLGNLPNGILDCFGVYHISKVFRAGGTGLVKAGQFLPGKSLIAPLAKSITTKEFALGTLGKEIIPEGIQEMNNHYQNKKFERDIDLQTGRAYKDYSLGEWFSDPNMWNAGFWGALSGGIFTVGGSTFAQVSENIKSGQSWYKGVGPAVQTGITSSQRKMMEEQGKKIDETYAAFGKYIDMQSVAEAAGDKALFEQAQKHLTLITGMTHLQMGTFDEFMKVVNKTQENLSAMKEKGMEVDEELAPIAKSKDILDRAKGYYVRGFNLYGLKDRPLIEYAMYNESLFDIEKKLQRETTIRGNLYAEDKYGMLKDKSNKRTVEILNEIDEIYSGEELTDKQQKTASDLIAELKTLGKNTDNVVNIADIEVARLSLQRAIAKKSIKDIVSGKRAKEITKQERFTEKNKEAGEFMYGNTKSPGVYDQAEDLKRKSLLRDVYDAAINDSAIEILDNNKDMDSLNGVLMSMMSPVAAYAGNNAYISKEAQTRITSVQDEIRQIENGINENPQISENYKPGTLQYADLMYGSNPINENIDEQTRQNIHTVRELARKSNLATYLLKQYNSRFYIDRDIDGNTAAEYVVGYHVDKAADMIEKTTAGLTTAGEADINTAKNIIAGVKGFFEHDEVYDKDTEEFKAIKETLSALDERLIAITEKYEKTKDEAPTRQVNVDTAYKNDITTSIKLLDDAFTSTLLIDIANKINALVKNKEAHLKDLVNKRSLALDKATKSIPQNSPLYTDIISNNNEIAENPEVVIYSTIANNDTYASENAEYLKTLRVSDIKGSFLESHKEFISACTEIANINRMTALLNMKVSYGDMIMGEFNTIDMESGIQPTLEQEATIREAMTYLLSGSAAVAFNGLTDSGKTSMARILVRLLNKTGYTKITTAAKYEHQFNKLNKSVFGENGTFEEVFSNQELLNKKLLDNEVVIIAESGMLTAQELNRLHIAYINAVGQGSNPQIVFLNDPSQKRDISYFPSMLKTRATAGMNEWNASKVKILPAMTVQQRAKNINISTLLNMFADDTNDVLYGRDGKSIAGMTHNIQKTYGVDTSQDREMFISILRDRDRNDGVSRIVIVDSPNKKATYKFSFINVVTAAEAQGLNADEVYIDMGYLDNPKESLKDNNSKWYNAINRARNYVHIFNPAISQTTEIHMMGAEVTSQQALVDTWRTNNVRYVNALREYAEVYSVDNNISTGDTNVATNTDKVPIQAQQTTGQELTDTQFLNQVIYAPDLIPTIHPRNINIVNLEIKPGDDVSYIYAWKQYRKTNELGQSVMADRVVYKTYLAFRDGKWHQLAVEPVDVLITEDMPTLADTYGDNVKIVGSGLKVRDVRTFGYAYGDVKLPATQAEEKILSYIASNFKAKDGILVKPSDINTRWVIVTNENLAEIKKVNASLEVGNMALLISIKGRKGFAIQFDGKKLSSDMTESGVNQLNILNRFYSSVLNVEKAINGAIAVQQTDKGEAPVEYFKFGSDDIIPNESTSITIKGVETTKNITGHYYFMSMLDYSYANGVYTPKSVLPRVQALYDAINALEEGTKKEIIANIDAVRSMMYSSEVSNHYLTTGASIKEDSRNKNAIMEGTDSKNVSDKIDKEIVFSPELSGVLSTLKDAGVTFIPVQNKKKATVLRATFEVAGTHGEKGLLRTFHVKIDYPLEQMDNGQYTVSSDKVSASIHSTTTGIKRDYRQSGNTLRWITNTGEYTDNKIPIADHMMLEEYIVGIINKGENKRVSGEAQNAIESLANSNKKIYTSENKEFISLRKSEDEDFTGEPDKPIGLKNMFGSFIPAYDANEKAVVVDGVRVGVSLRTLFESLLFNVDNGIVVDNPNLNRKEGQEEGFGLRANITQWLVSNANKGRELDEFNRTVESRVVGYRDAEITFDDGTEVSEEKQLAEEEIPEGEIIATDLFSATENLTKSVKTKEEDTEIPFMSGNPKLSNPLLYEDALKVARKIIPDITERELRGVYHIANATQGEIAYGRFKEGIIYLLYGDNNTFDEQQVRHEAFHKVFRQYIPIPAAQKLLQETRESVRFGEYAKKLDIDPQTCKDIFVEEYLASRFQTKNLDGRTFLGKIMHFLRNIMTEMSAIFSRSDRYVTKILDNIDKGLYKTKYVENAEVKGYADMTAKGATTDDGKQENKFYTDRTLVTDNTKDYYEDKFAGKKYYRLSSLLDFISDRGLGDMAIEWANDDYSRSGLTEDQIYQVKDTNGNVINEMTYEQLVAEKREAIIKSRQRGRAFHKYMEYLILRERNEDTTKVWAEFNKENEYISNKGNITIFYDVANNHTTKDLIMSFYNQEVASRISATDDIYSEVTHKIMLPAFDMPVRGSKDLVAMSGIAGTADIVIDHGDDTVSLYDFKTGSLNERGGKLFSILKEYGNKRMTALNAATLKLTLNAFLLRANDKNKKIKEISLIQYDENGESQVHNIWGDMLGNLKILELYFQKNHKDFYNKNKDLFDYNTYEAIGVTTTDREMTGKSTYEVWKSKWDLLLKRLQEFTETKAHRAYKGEELNRLEKEAYFNLIAEIEKHFLGRSSSLEAGDVESLDFFTAHLGNLYDRSSRIMQMLKSMEGEAVLEINREVQKLSDAHDKLNKFRESRMSKGLLQVGAKYKEDYADMWVKKDDNGWYIRTWKDKGWDRLSKQEKDYANHWRWDIRYMLFSAMQPDLGITFINKELKERNDLTPNDREYLNNQITELEKLPKWNKFKISGLDKFNYFEGWTPRVDKTEEESKTFAERGKKEFKATLLSRPEELAAIARDDKSRNYVGMPVRYMGREADAAQRQETEYTWNTEIIFKEFVLTMSRKKLMDDLHNFAIGVKNYLSHADEVRGTNLYKQTMNLIEGQIKGVMEWQKINNFGTRGIVARGSEGNEIGKYTLDRLLIANKVYWGITLQALNIVGGIRTSLTQIIRTVNRGLAGTYASWAASILGVKYKVDYRAADTFKTIGVVMNMLKDLLSGKKMDNKLYLMTREWGNLVSKYDFDMQNKQNLRTGVSFFLWKHLNTNMAYIAYRIGDTFAYSMVLYPMMQNMKIDVNGKLTSMWDLYEVQDGKLVYTGPERGVSKTTGKKITELTADEIAVIKNVSRKLTGNMRDDEKTLAHLSTLGAIAVQFKNFFWATFESAWKSEGKSHTLGSYMNTSQYEILDINRPDYGKRFKAFETDANGKVKYTKDGKAVKTEELIRLEKEKAYMLPVMEWADTIDEGYMRVSLGLMKTAAQACILGRLIYKNPRKFKEEWNSLSDVQKQNVFFCMSQFMTYALLTGFIMMMFGDADSDDFSDPWKLQAIMMVDDTMFETLVIDAKGVYENAISIPSLKQTFSMAESTGTFLRSLYTGERVQTGTRKGQYKGQTAFLKGIVGARTIVTNYELLGSWDDFMDNITNPKGSFFGGEKGSTMDTGRR